MTTTWRYAFAREPTTEGVWWSVREVYTDDEGKLSWTGAIAPGGETFRELLNDLVLMDLALGHAILDLTLSEPKLVPWPEPDERSDMTEPTLSRVQEALFTVLNDEFDLALDDFQKLWPSLEALLAGFGMTSTAIPEVS